MAKGIVVVDDIPVICAECDFSHLTQNKQYFHCDVKNKTVYNAKPDWCPIKEIPVRLEELKYSHSMGDYQRKGFSRGWNACLDEIEGSAEK